jgi:hypothetical protein
MCAAGVNERRSGMLVAVVGKWQRRGISSTAVDGERRVGFMRRGSTPSP